MKPREFLIITDEIGPWEVMPYRSEWAKEEGMIHVVEVKNDLDLAICDQCCDMCCKCPCHTGPKEPESK